MTTVVLPVELAPALREEVASLLSQVTLVDGSWWTLSAPAAHIVNRCVVCHQAGKLGGHHGRDGRVEWIHKSCHRRLHRRQRAAA